MNIAHIRAALAHQTFGSSSVADQNHVAVALVLAGSHDDLSLCVIQRASHERDVWSGHIALPGGRANDNDASAAETAERETREEVGLRLGSDHRIGALPNLRVRLAGREHGLILSSLVYFVGKAPALNIGKEAVMALWVPLTHLWDEKNATHILMSDSTDSMHYPAIRFGTHIIWGITLRVLMIFSDIVGFPLPHLEEIPGLREPRREAPP